MKMPQGSKILRSIPAGFRCFDYVTGIELKIGDRFTVLHLKENPREMPDYSGLKIHEIYTEELDSEAAKRIINTTDRK